MKKIYLACPYSHTDERVRHERFEIANRVAGRLMEEGNIVFSPISHSHPISMHLGNSLHTSFWMEQDEPFMDWADEIHVIRADGWQESIGVSWETKYFFNRNKPVYFIDP